MKAKNIVQVIPNLSPRDAVGEETLALDTFLRESGIETDIYALHKDKGASERAKDFFELMNLDASNSLVLYHYSIGSRIPYFLAEWQLPVILRFHNITPARFFSHLDHEDTSISACHLGWQQMPMLLAMSRYALPVSSYNARTLQHAGGEIPTKVIPILRDYKAFTPAPHHRKAGVQILFVGRISPNKCQHDLLALLDLYKRFVNKDCRLVLVGSGFSKGYYQSLLDLARKLELKISEHDSDDADVIFLHGVSQERLVRLYQESTVFVSMSEHEGFCVPLIEAMHAGLPIIAHKAAAIPETLGDAGILVEKQNMLDVLTQLKVLVEENVLRSSQIERAKKRAQLFSFEHVQKQFGEFLRMKIREI